MYDIIQQHIRPVLIASTTDFKLFQQKLGKRMSVKLQSEIMSALIQEQFEQQVPAAQVGAGDHEADVYIAGAPLELKTSYGSREWRGGEYSKRSGDFLLISWKLSDTNIPTWCALHATLNETDWKSSVSKNYYATTISLDEVLRKGGRVLVGNVRKAKKLQHPMYEYLVKVKRRP